MWVAADDNKLQYSGRIGWKKNPDGNEAALFYYAASLVRVRFRGCSIKAVIQNKRVYWSNYLGVIIDGIQTKICLDKEENAEDYLLCDNLTDEEHELILFKRQDACHMFTLYGFELDGSSPELLPVAKKPERRIEVFGDSVSCGEVSEAVEYVGKKDPEHDGEFSNSWYSYAWMTARRLGAELHDTSQGGIALLDGTGWFAEPDYQGMESCYDKLAYNPQLGETSCWDFSRYTPQIVIVAIGQNDNHPDDYMADDYEGERADNWRKHYKKFVMRLMEIYPLAHIILQTTLLQHDVGWDKSIEEVCRQIDSPRVHHFLYRRNGCATPGHLRISEAEEMASELGTYIESFGKEIWK